MTQYLILIYGSEEAYGAPGGAVWEENGVEHGKFWANNAAAVRGGNALEFTTTATSIRTGADGEQTVTDGPFAETKEALGGYYVIEADDLDAAIAIAKQVPAPFGGVEIRPIMAMG